MSTKRSAGLGVPAQETRRSAATNKKDRSRLCAFTFADGRQCRTPRRSGHPNLCFDHAQKEARARAAHTLGKDLAYFFSGEYLSACDLSAALGRLMPAIVRGDVKPRTARTVAYMAQTLLQAIHLSQHEYGEAFGGDGWRKAIRNSVNHNHDYLFPPAPKPKQAQSPQPQPAQLQARPSQTHPPQPAPSLQTPLPPSAAEFAQQVLAGRNLSRPGRETGSLPATPHVQPAPPNPQPAEPPANCHSGAVAQAFRPEESAFSFSPVCHAERSEASHPIPTTPPAQPKTTPSSSVPLTPTGATSPAPPQPSAQPRASQPVNPREPNRDAPWLHWSPTSNIPPDSKLL